MVTPQSNVGYVDTEYLHVVGELLDPLKKATYRQMQLAPGQRVLDVGCGPGTDTLPLARIVGESGAVVGVDYDTEMIAEADRRAQAAGVSGWVQHKFADATSLPFADGEFDACRSERLFQHISDQPAALAEMARVTRAGGRVVVLDTDWGSCSIAAREIDIERRFMRFFIEATHNNGYSGRELYRLFREQGLVDVTAEVFPVAVTSYALLNRIMTIDIADSKALAAGVINQEEWQRWRADLQRAEDEGTFFGYFCMVLVSGRKVWPLRGVVLRAATAADQALIRQRGREARLNTLGLAWTNFVVAEALDAGMTRVVGMG